MSKKIAGVAILAGALCGYLAVHLEHTAQNQACTAGWIADIQAERSGQQEANHELPFQNAAQFQQQIPAHITNCVPADPTEDFVNGSVVAILFGCAIYFALLIFRKVSKVLS